MSNHPPALRKVLTTIELGMQRRLYGRRSKRVTAVPDSAMWRALRALRAHSNLNSFRIWLVGSRVEPGRFESDIDVILSPRAGFPLRDQTIERALWYCRNYGLYLASPRVVVDPCFRAAGPTLELSALRPHSILKSVKLLSPKLTQEVLAGRIRGYRRLGYFSIEYWRRTGDTNYYAKLPRRSFGGRQSPYLRPAIEVVS